MPPSVAACSHSAHRVGRVVSLAAFIAAFAPGAATPRDAEVLFFPTPQAAVEKMLELAAVTSSDYLIDLGSGDGRIPITAAKSHGARALGVDIDAALVLESRASAEREGVADRVEFKEQDLFKTELSEATVITMFLLTSINIKLRPTLMGLRPGTRIVSYSFNMGDWAPDRTETVDGRNIYLWVVGKPSRGPADGATP